MSLSNKQSLADSIAAFHDLHQQRFGFCDVSKSVEIVNLRLRMIAAGEPYAPAHREPVPARQGRQRCGAAGILRGRLPAYAPLRSRALLPAIL